MMLVKLKREKSEMRKANDDTTGIVPNSSSNLTDQMAGHI